MSYAMTLDAYIEYMMKLRGEVGGTTPVMRYDFGGHAMPARLPTIAYLRVKRPREQYLHFHDKHLDSDEVRAQKVIRL